MASETELFEPSIQVRLRQPNTGRRWSGGVLCSVGKEARLRQLLEFSPDLLLCKCVEGSGGAPECSKKSGSSERSLPRALHPLETNQSDSFIPFCRCVSQSVVNTVGAVDDKPHRTRGDLGCGDHTTLLQLKRFMSGEGSSANGMRFAWEDRRYVFVMLLANTPQNHTPGSSLICK